MISHASECVVVAIINSATVKLNVKYRIPGSPSFNAKIIKAIDYKPLNDCHTHIRWGKSMGKGELISLNGASYPTKEAVRANALSRYYIIMQNTYATEEEAMKMALHDEYQYFRNLKDKDKPLYLEGKPVPVYYNE
jgi:hypothetical protein